MNKKGIIIGVVVVLIVILVVVFGGNSNSDENGPIKIGWVSDLTGPASQYGSIEAARIAVDEINAKGGIDGREIVLIEEDGMCDAKTALNATRKLIDVNNVKYILGGHCSSETLAMGPIAQEKGVIMLASISTSPGISDLGDFVFRTSPISTQQSEIVAQYAIENNISNIGVIYEIKDYPKPIADAFKIAFEEKGGDISVFEGFPPEENDFRSILSKMKESGVEAIFISPQAPEKAALILKQMEEMNINVQVFGNEQVGSKVTIDSVGNEIIDGLIFGEPSFDTKYPKTKKFIESYNQRWGTEALPLGIWTAENYDAVYILAEAIDSAKGNVEKVKKYLLDIKDYDGVSGKITIDENGDGIREYSLKKISDGQVEVIK